MLKQLRRATTIPKAIVIGVIIYTQADTVDFIAKTVWSVAMNPYVEFVYDEDQIVTSRVVAKVDQKYFIGTASGDIDGKGTINIRSMQDSNIKCIGSFEYVSRKLLSGKGTLNCNDGNIAVFNFKGRDNVSGEGYGRSTLGPVSFTYGYSPDESSSAINVPTNLTKP